MQAWQLIQYYKTAKRVEQVIKTLSAAAAERWPDNERIQAIAAALAKLPIILALCGLTGCGTLG